MTSKLFSWRSPSKEHDLAGQRLLGCILVQEPGDLMHEVSKEHSQAAQKHGQLAAQHGRAVAAQGKALQEQAKGNPGVVEIGKSIEAHGQASEQHGELAQWYGKEKSTEQYGRSVEEHCRAATEHVQASASYVKLVNQELGRSLSALNQAKKCFEQISYQSPNNSPNTPLQARWLTLKISNAN